MYLCVCAVAKFAADVVAPRVQSMDQAGEMDHTITKGLFENGVSAVVFASWRLMALSKC